MTQPDSAVIFEMKLEVVPLPVADVDAAKAFYVEKVGFHLDHDVSHIPGMRVCQLTPPGSACSVVIGTGMGEISEVKPGTIKGLHLVVVDVQQAHDVLAARGVPVSDVQDMGGVKYVFFSDPDGNSWAVQQLLVRP